MVIQISVYHVVKTRYVILSEAEKFEEIFREVEESVLFYGK